MFFSTNVSRVIIYKKNYNHVPHFTPYIKLKQIIDLHLLIKM